MPLQTLNVKGKEHSELKDDLYFFLRFYLFIFREKGRERRKEKHHCVVASRVPPIGKPGPQPRHVP